MSEARRQHHRSLMRVNHRYFNGEWTQVETVRRMGDAVRIEFNPDRELRAEFDARVVWRDEIGEIIAEETVPGLSVASVRWLTAPAALRDRRLRLSLWLDDAAAFTGWFDPEPETLIPPVP